MFEHNKYIISDDRLKVFLKINTSRLEFINNSMFLTYEMSLSSDFYDPDNPTERCQEIKT